MLRILALMMLLGLAHQSGATVLQLKELNVVEIESLDKAKTVLILPGGILEQHGPYLPSFTDGYVNEALAKDLARAASEEGWTAVVFPTIPLGSGGANEIGLKHSFPGTYAIRADQYGGWMVHLTDLISFAAGEPFLEILGDQGE